jgi:hypothetical protein
MQDQILKFKDLHKGKRCFIACTGPSLNDINMTLLKKEIIFGLNRGYLKKEMPITYLVSTDPEIETQYRKELENYNKCKAKFSFNKLKNSISLNCTLSNPIFSSDLSKPFWRGHSVTSVAIHIAYYMGFRIVYIIGMDHSYNHKAAQPLPFGHHKYLKDNLDINHFSCNYISKNIVFSEVNLKGLELAYSIATKYYESNNRKLYNASTRTKLSEDIMPRVNFESIFKPILL